MVQSINAELSEQESVNVLVAASDLIFKIKNKAASSSIGGAVVYYLETCMKIMMTSFLFALSLSASAASFNCQITELDEVGSPISQASDVVVNVSEVSSKAVVIGQSSGRVYGLSIVDGLNICFKYSEAKCVTLARLKILRVLFYLLKTW